MFRPPSTLQHFSLIAQSNNAILSILMCDFLFQLSSSFVIARRILVKTSRHDDMYQFLVLVLYKIIDIKINRAL